MKLNMNKIARFKFFDESRDQCSDSLVYKKIRTYLILLACGAAISSISSSLLFSGSTTKILLSLTCVAQALLSGVEWHMGLKAKALNNLIETIWLMLLMLLIVH